jgi:hypothetical protein
MKTGVVKVPARSGDVKSRVPRVPFADDDADVPDDVNLWVNTAASRVRVRIGGTVYNVNAA